MGNENFLHSRELVREIVSKLPAAIVYSYNHYVNTVPRDQPRLETISRFLYSEAEMACRAGTSKAAGSQERDKEEKSKRPGQTKKAETHAKTALLCTETKDPAGSGPSAEDGGDKQTRKRTCHYCARPEHIMIHCKEFIALTVQDRWEWAKKGKLCFRCLGGRHRSNKCSGKVCPLENCGRPHHHLLHEKRKAASLAPAPRETRAAPVTPMPAEASVPAPATTEPTCVDTVATTTEETS